MFKGHRQNGLAPLVALEDCNLWSRSLLIGHSLEHEEVGNFNGSWLKVKHEISARVLAVLSKELFKEVLPEVVNFFDSAPKVTVQDVRWPNEEELGGGFLPSRQQCVQWCDAWLRPVLRRSR